MKGDTESSTRLPFRAEKIAYRSYQGKESSFLDISAFFLCLSALPSPLVLPCLPCLSHLFLPPACQAVAVACSQFSGVAWDGQIGLLNSTKGLMESLFFKSRQ